MLIDSIDIRQSGLSLKPGLVCMIRARLQEAWTMAELSYMVDVNQGPSQSTKAIGFDVDQLSARWGQFRICRRLGIFGHLHMREAET
jgi:hypothetical protein